MGRPHLLHSLLHTPGNICPFPSPSDCPTAWGAATLRAACETAGSPHPPSCPQSPNLIQNTPSPRFRPQTTRGVVSEASSPAPSGSGSPGIPHRILEDVALHLSGFPAASREKRGAVVFALLFAQVTAPLAPPSTPTPTPPRTQPHTPPPHPPPDARAGKPRACRHNP